MHRPDSSYVAEKTKPAGSVNDTKFDATLEALKSELPWAAKPVRELENDNAGLKRDYALTIRRPYIKFQN